MATIRRLPCPVTEPPYDDEVHPPPTPGGAAAPTQGALALAFTMPSGVSAEPEPPAGLRLVDPPVDDDPSGERAAAVLDQSVAAFAARRPTSADQLPEPRRWSARLAQAIVETLHGHRPIQQLLRWTDDAVYALIADRLASRRRVPRRRSGGGTRPTIRSIRVCTPADGVAEASVVVQAGSRCRALAMRLEGLDGQWRCTALEII